MYSVSPEFLTAMDSPVQEHKVTGTIGSATFGPANILAGSFSINAKLCSEQEIQIGQVYIAELSATFRNVSVNPGEWQGKVITPTFSLKTENGWEDVPLGVFTVQEATISASGVTVKAYDNMAKFDKYCTTYRGAGGGAGVEGATSVVVGRTTYDMIMMICRKVGVDFGMTRMEVAALPNSGNGWDLFSDNDITTYRDMLSWMAQTLACNATINREGKLVLVPFKSASDYTFDDEHRHEGASFKDFTTRITEIWLDCKPMEKSYSYHVTPNNGLSYELGQNPYLQIGTAEDRDDAMNDILTALQEVNYTPFDVNLTGCPVFDLGDVLTFTGGITSGLKKGAVTSFTYTYNAAYKLACGGKNPAEASAKSATDKRMDGINSSVTSQGKPVMVVRNAESVTLGDGSEVTVIDYPFEVTDSVNLTIVSTQILMTTEATETETGDVFTIGDIVARAILYLDGIEIGDLYPEFIVDEGTDTINFDYSLKNLTVGAHNYTVKLELSGGDGEINENDVHESLWGYGITFEVYLKSIQVVSGKNRFILGKTLDTSDWNVRGINNNGTVIAPLTGWTTDPADGTVLDEEGTISVDVIYEDVSGSYDIEVLAIRFVNSVVGIGFGSLFSYLSIIDADTLEIDQLEGFVQNANFVGFTDRDAFYVATVNGETVYILYNGIRSISSDSGQHTTGTVLGACNGGVVFGFGSSGDLKIGKFDGSAASGTTSETTLGSLDSTARSVSAAYAANNSKIVPFYAYYGTSASDRYYGYVDVETGVITEKWQPYLTIKPSNRSTITGSSYVANGNDCYYFYCAGKYKHMHAYVNGEHHFYDMTSISNLDGDNGMNVSGRVECKLFYDTTANCLVLYLVWTNGHLNNTTDYRTECFKINPDGHTVLETVTMPSYLDIPYESSADASTLRIWMNADGVADGTSYNPVIVDGIRYDYVNAVLTDRYRVYFDDLGYVAPDQVIIADGTLAGGLGFNNGDGFIYIDNLYMNSSAGNVLKRFNPYA